MHTIDYIVIAAYAIGIVSLGLWVSRDKGGKKKTARDYFLAGNTLTWWAIGSSLIASNISAEQFIAMSGSGYEIGMGIATYEFMAAATLIVVAIFLLPIYLKKQIYTMPQFLEMRYDGRVRNILAVFWLLVFVFVNLTSVMYLGALAMETLVGTSLLQGILILAAVAALYSLYGGLMAVAWTDVVQVIILTIGGLVTTWFALDAVGGDAGGPMEGMGILLDKTSEKFDMILTSEHPAYDRLPGISVLIGGMWIANLYYWGFNQYITQRALAAKNIGEAQKGLLFAAYLKLLMPLVVVIPGIAAFYLVNDAGDTEIGNAMLNELGQVKPDKAYGALLNKFVPTGLKGLAFAALAAAIVSSLASMLNSTSTIFTMDLYRNSINPKASETDLVRTGRIVAAVALVVAVIIAPQLKTLDEAFQFIQEFTGFVSPGILAIFLVGMFVRFASANSAVIAAILTIPMGYGIKFLAPNVPFLDRMGIVFLILVAVMLIISAIEKGTKADPKSIELNREYFRTSNAFNIGAIGVAAILVVIYTVWW